MDDEDIMLDLALCREQGAIGPAAFRQARQLAGEQVVQEVQRAFARQPDDGAGGEGLCCER